ncbi:hypothetical protein cypCar_00048369, partial [Cyprinus carpio]
LRVGDHMMFVQLQLAAQPSVSRGPAGPNQTPAGAVSSDSQQQELDVTKSHNAPPSSHVHHAHSTQSHAPALHSHPGSHTHPPQSPAHAPPCAQAEGSTQSPRQRCKPGAVIESLVNHSPGVFSGTFSGKTSLHRENYSSQNKRLVSTSLPPLHPSGERLRQTENKATRCKVEQLRLLLQQRRLRRKARRDTRGPYHWPSDRSHRNSSLSSHGSLDLDYEEPVWKPDVPSDMNAEFVLA